MEIKKILGNISKTDIPILEEVARRWDKRESSEEQASLGSQGDEEYIRSRSLWDRPLDALDRLAVLAAKVKAAFPDHMEPFRSDEPLTGVVFAGLCVRLETDELPAELEPAIQALAQLRSAASLKTAIDRLATSDEMAKTTKPSGRKAKPAATVNQRMAGTIMENPDAMGWNSTQWAKHLKCGKSSVVESRTWKKLESARVQAKAERMKDRRRKPKASDSRQD